MDQKPAATTPFKISPWHIKTCIITVVLAVVGYLLFMLWAGWDHVIHAMYSVGIKGIAVALSLSLINYALRFFRWQKYLQVLDCKVPWLESLSIYISGFALTTTPGKTGEAMRCIFLKKYGMPYRTSLGAFFSERATDLIVMVILSAFSLWNYQQAKFIVVAVAFILLAVIIIVQKKSWLKAIENLAKKTLPSRFAHIIEFGIEMVLAFSKCFEIKMLLFATMIGLIAWGAEGVALYYLLHLLGQDVSFSNAIFIYSFSILIGAISFLPGGLGGAEVTMIELLKFFGVPLPTSVALTLIIRLATLWFSVILGLLALPRVLSKTIE